MHDARNAKFLKRLGELGFCCPKHFFFTFAEESPAVLARLTGTKPRTIRFWKARNLGCGFCAF